MNPKVIELMEKARELHYEAQKNLSERSRVLQEANRILEDEAYYLRIWPWIPEKERIKR